MKYPEWTGRGRGALAVMILLAAGLAGCGAEPDGTEQQGAEESARPNFVVILSDDQNTASMDYMPITNARLADTGLTADKAFVTIPECCPFRGSFLGGGFYPANTGVLSNLELNGAAHHFNEDNTLATRLTAAGYRTGFIGKYLHGYKPGHIPPGWDTFIANDPHGVMSQDWFSEENITIGGRDAPVPDGEILATSTDYVTDFHRDRALEFLASDEESPFFLLVSAIAPHLPATPAKGDENLFTDVTLETFTEDDISDKPDWVRQSLKVARKRCELRPDFWREQLRSLQALDRTVGRIVDALAAKGELDNTYIVFTSDNGVQVSNCSLMFDKGMEYDESIGVPFVVRGPGVRQGRTDKLVAVNLDLPQTILNLAGDTKQGDGVDLRPLLEDGDAVRDDMLIENFGYLGYRRMIKRPPIWSGIRTERWKYVEHASGESELYDLKSDPQETEGLQERPETAYIQADLKKRLEAQPRALAITSAPSAAGKPGTPFSFQLTAWGGAPPYHWSIRQSLPEGLTLDAETGEISGAVAALGDYRLMVTVSDQGRRAQSGVPSTYHALLNLSIAGAADLKDKDL